MTLLSQGDVKSLYMQSSLFISRIFSLLVFFYCTFAKKICHWLSSVLNSQCSFSSITKAINFCNRSISRLCKLVVLASVIHNINIIWSCRNQRRFGEKVILFRLSINLIITGRLSFSNFTFQVL